jgi:hypothetical protein
MITGRADIHPPMDAESADVVAPRSAQLRNGRAPARAAATLSAMWMRMG